MLVITEGRRQPMKNRIGNIVIGVFFFLCFLSIFQIRATFAGIYMLYPVNGENGSVDSSYPDTNFYDYGLSVYHYGDDQHIVYLKYDLSSISDHTHIDSVVLIARYGGLSQYYGPVPVDIYYVSNDSWSARTFTWNTRPDLDVLLARSTFDENVQPTVWDLSCYNYKLDQRDNYLSLAMVQPNSTVTGIGFVSPFIVITTKPHIPPQP
jgi:hypothetical protein